MGHVESFDCLDYCFEVVEIFAGSNFIDFSYDYLDVYVVATASLDKLEVVIFDSMLQIDAEEDL